MADRTMATTKQRIYSLLSRNPYGIPRASLHGCTGDTALIHAALDELLDEGVVTERLITSVRGKPRREYILTENLLRLGIPKTEGGPARTEDVLPGAKAIVEYIVQHYPGTSRSEMWSKAVVTKNWVSNALAELIREGKIVEIMEEDVRGGLIRRYIPANSPNSPRESNTDTEKIKVAS